MNIYGHQKTFLSIALALALASAATLIVKGLNWGIDFQGGTLLERGVPGAVAASDVRDALIDPALEQYDLGESVIQPLEESSADFTVMMIRTRSFESSTPIDAIDAVLAQRFGDVDIRRTELVGPVIGRELVNRALWALFLTGLGVLIYISFRFEYRFGVAAVIGLAHDALLALGIVSLLGHEINSSFIAAILTVVGYSINATIVIFDRIRENLSLRKESVGDLLNRSVNQTLARSINTSMTTLFIVGALYFLGGTTIKTLALTLMVGICAGTFSSIFVVGPLWALLAEGADKRTAKAA